MSLLRSLLLDKKIFEAQEEIDQFFENNEIEEGSLINRIDFDKGTFDSKEQVNDFLDSHFLSGHTIDDEKKKFTVVLFDEVAFVKSTVKEIKFRDGIIIVIGILKPMTSDNPLLFKDGGASIKLSSDHPYVIELARTIKGFHASYGDVEITKKDLISFKNNFDNNVVGVDLSIDFDHETREAAGWVKEVFLSEDGEMLLGGIRWTPKGALALSDREFRYLSPEFHKDWLHPHTGKTHGPTLLGAALVNRPFLKMDAIVSLTDKTKGDSIVDTIKLSDHQEKVTDLQNQISSLTLSETTAKTAITEMKAANVALTDQVKNLTEAADKKKKEDEFNLLFTEQKINKAQHEALLAGKSMVEVLTLSEKMNVEAKGDGAADNTSAVKLSDKEIKICKDLGLTPEEFQQYNGGE